MISTVPDPHPLWNSITDSATVYISELLYNPPTWSEAVNGDVYQLVGAILQAAEAHNITIDGGINYNVPSGNFTIHIPSETGTVTSQNLTSYTQVAIVGADDLDDDNVTVKDVFDVIVDITREVTPTCEFPVVRSHLFVLLTRPGSSRNLLGSWVRAGRRTS